MVIALHPKGLWSVTGRPCRKLAVIKRILALCFAVGVQPSAAAPSACSGSTEIPRQVIALYDGRAEPAPAQSRLHRYAALPLHHKGYALRFVDVAMPLPEFPDVGVFAGVVSMFGSAVPEPDALADWLVALDAACGVPLPMVVIGHLGFGSSPGPAGDAVLAKLGLRMRPGVAAFGGTAAAVVAEPGFFGAEADPLPRPGLYDLISAATGTETLMQIETALGPVVLATLTGTGIYLHQDATMAEDPRGGGLWIVDPFAVFGLLGGPDPWPVPDTTTLNNRRMFLATVTPENWLGRQSGGAAQTVGRPAHDLLDEQVMQPFADLPITLALDLDTLTPEAARAAADASRAAVLRMLARASVLPAVWRGPASLRRAADTASNGGASVLSAGADLQSLIGAAVLAAVWAPGSVPSQSDLASVIKSLGIAPTFGASRAEVPPPVMPNGAGEQVLAAVGPVTPKWADPSGLHSLGPWWEMTDTPRRLTPVHVVIPAGAMLNPAARYAAIRALQSGRGADLVAVSAAQYHAIVSGFQTVRLRPVAANRWDILDRGGLQTFRLDAAAGMQVDLPQSQGVLGQRRQGDALYVALDPAEPQPRIALARAQDGAAADPARPVLLHSGLELSDLRTTPCGISVTARGTSPGEAVWQAVPGTMFDVTLQPEAGGPTSRLALLAGADGLVTLPLPTAPGVGVRADLRTGC